MEKVRRDSKGYFFTNQGICTLERDYAHKCICIWQGIIKIFKVADKRLEESYWQQHNNSKIVQHSPVTSLLSQETKTQQENSGFTRKKWKRERWYMFSGFFTHKELDTYTSPKRMCHTPWQITCWLTRHTSIKSRRFQNFWLSFQIMRHSTWKLIMNRIRESNKTPGN